MGHDFSLRYSTPADAWRDAIPLGNGRLGAMVYGHTDIERIQLNDDSLWYGTFIDRNNSALKDKLPEIRRLILAGDISRAEELIMKYMAGTPAGMRHYTLLGVLNIAMNQHLPFVMGWLPKSESAEEYELNLDLMAGVLDVKHKAAGVSYQRRMFISHPAQVMCIRYTCDSPGAINMDMFLNRVGISDATVMDDRRPGRRVAAGGWPGTRVDSIRNIDERTMLMRGNDAGVQFACAVRVVCDGEIENPVSQLVVKNCSEVVLYLASSTSNRVPDPVADVLKRLDQAENRGYDELLEEHVQDFSALMNRCVLELEPASADYTDQRIEAVRSGGQDPGLAALYFQLGRYLIVSGGREGSSALNLQGIWNHQYMPMWDSKYTININLQMNYWPVEVTNLSELHMPLMDLLEKMQEKGRETARVMYGMRGMVCHHNTDFYGDCAPQDWYMAAMPWVTGSAWLGLHVWEHYLYTKDLSVLKRMYPVLRDMALFYQDFLIEVDGKLVTCPSVSPENRYVLPDGYDTPICVGPAMDNQILREFFGALIQIQELLGVDQDLARILAEMIEKLPEDKIGSQGQLLEWDQEYPELTPGMSHISHLFACHPGCSINWWDTPELMQAVKRSLEIRTAHGGAVGGWPLAWHINMNARLLDPVEVDKCINRMLARSAARNLLNARGVFQIDGNLGATAGIAECLLQSHIALHFLPALPVSWQNGSVKGLRARGARTVDLSWEAGVLQEAIVRPDFDGDIEVVGNPLKVSCDSMEVATTVTDIGFSFYGEAGKTYILTALE
ncbi:MAG: glycoside hydrolase family 95 protein [Firmicutes bacterium]|jgi:alpha-L-fucosidase 2|nr:glycoside hydrolase family 95 protein [Bacillota bacterium]NLL88161.1 glycoside hydrolase family 95 protein [Bacillota bacterium]